MKSKVSRNLTLDIEREKTDPCADPRVHAANEAFGRIEGHRRLFRTDWLPFLDGVTLLSRAAWERTGSPTTLDGKPDWTHDPVQKAFRELTQDLIWADYLRDRRPLLAVLRRIGQDRARFLEWFDGQEESFRERVGHPETLWRRFEQNNKAARATDLSDLKDEKAVTAVRSDSEDEKAVTAARSDAVDAKVVTAARSGADKKVVTAARSDSKDEEVVIAPRCDSEDLEAVITQRCDSESEKARIAARSDAGRMTALVTLNEAWCDFGTKLRESATHGCSTLEEKLHGELERLLAAGSS